MSIVACFVCSAEFEARNSRHKFCTSRCKDRSKIAASGLTCFVCNEPMAKGPASKPQGEASHPRCRDVHGRTRYRQGCRCDICRTAQNVAVAAWVEKNQEHVNRYRREWRQDAYGTVPLADRELPKCFICGEALNGAARKSERPMHRACRDASPAWVQDGRESPRITEFRRRIAKAAAGPRPGRRVFVSGPCSWCGGHFVSPAGKFCSAKCKASESFRRRGGKFAFKPSPSERLHVYERDNWTCKICSRAVDPNVLYPSAWSASLDHIVPQSTMLVPDHSPSNLRLVHLWCNSARGDGSNMAEAELLRRVAEMWDVAA